VPARAWEPGTVAAVLFVRERSRAGEQFIAPSSAEFGREEPTPSDHIRRCPYAADRKQAGAVRCGCGRGQGQRSWARLASRDRLSAYRGGGDHRRQLTRILGRQARSTYRRTERCRRRPTSR
jgi:hypothetical protein